MTPQELKNSILQLAIQGKLVEQRPEEGKINPSGIKQKGTEEFEFDVPENWCLAHIETVTEPVPTKPFQILESEVLKKGKYPVISQSKEYTIGFSDKKEKLFQHKTPVIVFGDHTTEVKYIDFNFIVGADGVKIFHPIESTLLPRFFFYVLKYYTRNLNQIGGYSRHYKFIKNKPIPLPPLAEQKRIVAKIEELLPLTDRYGEAWDRLEELNKRFPDDMRKSVLQLAIQGKLVEQRPEEGTAEDLYKKIQAEKQKLIKAGKIKKEKPLPEITEDEVPFEIPENWKWVRLGEIGFTNIGLTYTPKDLSKDGTIVLRSSNIQNGKMDYDDIVRVKMEIPDNKMCHKGDVLICARNGSKRLVGKAAIVDSEGMSFGAFMAIFRSICNEFILQVINSIYFRNALLGETGTTTINQITQDMLKNVLTPLPPLAEQKRIVEKIEELLPLCNITLR